MEKFIRTKDGIYDTNKLNLNKIIGNIKYEIIDNILFKTMYGYEAHLYEYEIISKSDNLAELCDGYYLYNGYDDKFNPDRIYTTDEKTKALDDCKDLAFHIDLMCRGRYICELRAFIETDKGLIFIGKFNENGKLVLI